MKNLKADVCLIRETFNKLDNAKTGAEYNNENDTE